MKRTIIQHAYEDSEGSDIIFVDCLFTIASVPGRPAEEKKSNFRNVASAVTMAVAASSAIGI